MQTDPFIGKQIKDFTVQERIGRGGMASVYRAYQKNFNRYVALKIIQLNSEQGERDEFRRRFTQEANLIASLEHIHILPVHDYGIIDDEIAYLAMRLLRGGSLSNLIADGPMPLERIADIFTQIARGLSHAHAHGVIHRDLKPSNILLDETGNAYLTDFGLAKMVENSLELTKTGNIVGTPIYMSPEQLRGENVDHRSDIYSLGVILYHMLVGKPPFDSSESNVVSVIYQHLEKNPVPPREINPSIPPAVELIVLRALSKQPRERYNSANEMADELNMALGRKISSTSQYPVLSVPPSTGSVPIPQTKTGHPSTHTSTPKPISSVTGANSPRPGWLVPGLAVAAVVVLIALAAILLNPPGGQSVEVTPTVEATAVVSQPSAVPNATPIVVEGEVQTADSAVPTEAEIAAAQTRLGANGYLAYIACNRTSEYHARQAREMGNFAARYGLAYRVYDPENDAYRQLTEFERALSDGANLLIICPLDLSLLADSMASAQEAGVPMVLLSSGIENYGGVLLAGNDQLMGLTAGRAAGDIVVNERDGQARAIILDYPDIPIIVTRANGLEEGFLEVAPEAEVIGRYLGGTRDNGRASVEQLLEDGVEFDVILSINDAGAFGAIEALAAAGVDPEAVIVSSVDAEALALQYIRDGYYMRASVEIGREQFSRTAIDSAVKLLAGATLPETFLVPPGLAITREMLAEATPSADN